MGDAETAIINSVMGVTPSITPSDDAQSNTKSGPEAVVLTVTDRFEHGIDTVPDKLPGVKGRARTRPKPISGNVLGHTFDIFYDRAAKRVGWKVEAVSSGDGVLEVLGHSDDVASAEKEILAVVRGGISLDKQEDFEPNEENPDIDRVVSELVELRDRFNVLIDFMAGNRSSL